MKKVYPDAKSALEGVLKDGMMIMAGGFGLCGMPGTLIAAIRDSGVKNLTCVSNNAGIDGAGLGLLLETRQIKKMIASYVGENKLFAAQFLAGELEIEFNPQGTMAERIRAGGAGIPAFYTPTGVHTAVSDGGMPVLHAADGSVKKYSEKKEVRSFDGRDYVLPDDVKTLAEPTLAHRLIVRPAARVREISGPAVVADLLASTPVPGSRVPA